MHASMQIKIEIKKNICIAQPFSSFLNSLGQNNYVEKIAYWDCRSWQIYFTSCENGILPPL